MAVTFRAVGTSAGSNSARCIITKPVGLAVGDLMVAQVQTCDVPGTVGNVTDPGGWTKIRQDNQVDLDSGSALFWKIADASDVAASDFEFTATDAMSNRGAITAWYGHDPTTPINANNGTVGQGTIWACNGVTPSVANCMILLIAGIQDNVGMSGWGITVSDPGGWTEAYDLPTNLTDDLGLALAYAIRPETTATGVGIGTVGGNDTHTGQMLAITPGPADVIVTPEATIAVSNTQSPTIIHGSSSYTPTTASAVGDVGSTPPVVVHGSLSISPSETTSVASTSIDAVVHGSLAIAMGEVVGIGSTVDPALIHGSVSITPTEASAIASTIDPTVQIGGGISVSPAPAIAIASTINPIINGWYGSAWSHRIPVVIQSSEIGSNLTDFPCYVRLSDCGDCFWKNVKNGGGDIRITEGDGTTEVPREIVSCDTSAETGQIFFKGDFSSTTDTTYYIYIGNAAASDYAETATYGKHNTWNAVYVGVYHLDEVSGTIYDSTSNSNDSSSINGTPDYQETGQVGKCLKFILSSSEYIDFGDVDDFDFAGDLTVSLWSKTSYDVTAGAAVMMCKASGSVGWAISEHPNELWYIWFNNTEDESLTEIDDGLWHRYVLRRSGAGTDNVTAFIDKTEDLALTNTSSTANAGACRIGNWVSGDFYWDGFIDEVRVSNDDRTDDWLDAEYDNIKTPTTFYDIEPAEIGIDQESACPDPVSAVGRTIDPTVVIGGGVTVSPDPAIATASTVDPTAVHGSIAVSPTEVSSVALTVDPTILHGSIAITPTEVSSVGSTVNPTVIHGSLAITPTEASTIASTVDPTTIHGDLSITPTQVPAVASTVNPTTIHGAISITPTTASAVASTIDPTVVAGGDVTVSPSPATAIASTINPTAIQGSIAVSPSEATGIATATIGSIVHGLLAISPSEAVSVGSTVNPTVINVVVFTPASSVAIALTINPTAVHGSIATTPGSAPAIASTIDPTVQVGGGTFISPSPAIAIGSAIAPSVAHGSVAITPATSPTVGRTVNPTTVHGPLTITPSTATAVASTVAPQVLEGAIVITPTAASVIGSAVDPTIKHGSIQVAPSASIAVGVTINPTVIGGSLLITPATAPAVGSTVDPSVAIGGAVIVSPSPATAVASTIAPTVTAGSIVITPSTSSAVGAVVNPIVISAGNVSVQPSPVTAIGSTSGKTVMGSMIVYMWGEEAIAVGRTVDPTVPSSSQTIQVGAATALAQGTGVATPVTVIHGDLKIDLASSPVIAIGSCPNPVCYNGIKVKATPVAAVASTVAPTIIHSGISLGKRWVSAVGMTPYPTVHCGSTSASCGSAIAVVSTVDPTVIRGIDKTYYVVIL